MPCNMKSTCLTGVIFFLTCFSNYQTAKHEGIDATLVVSNASVFLLDPSSETLYLGARGTLQALHASNLTQKYPLIEWEVSEEKRKACVDKSQKEDDCGNYICLLEFLKNGTIYVCGSYAFDPQCAFIDPAKFSLMKDGDEVKIVPGKGRCPYKPGRSHTVVVADGVLYTATSSNYWGTEFDITRATDPPNQPVRMVANLLNDPEFVGSALVKDSHGEDKIYFFFTEIASEYNLHTKVRVTRIARVCKSDMGGSMTMQYKWTSFLKAQLLCQDQNKGRSYTILSHVYPLEHRIGDPSSTHFYALFTSQWESESVSAVCVYSLADISKLFANGGFRDMKTGLSVPGPTPRPGQCEYNNQTAQGYVSLKMPDTVLQFIKEHPLMIQTVETVPLLVRWGTTYTRIAASNVFNGDVVVLHLGTDQGELHSISVVGREVTLLKEIAVTTLVEPVNNILIHQGHALVGSPSALSWVLVDGCTVYPSCEVCAKAQGLGCVWDIKGRACVAKVAQSPVQNKSEDPLKACGTGEGRCSPLVKELHVREGGLVLLTCIPLSPLPCVWEKPQGRHTLLLHSNLVVTVSRDNVGLYSCRCPAQGDGLGNSKPCLTASYQLTMEEPNINGKMEPTVGIPPAGLSVVCFLLGVLLGALLTTVFLKRQCWRPQHTPLDDRN